ncbi:MAG: orotate phosphoribosyltransferase-like protein [Thermoplasmata archaeon]|nr:orotate phosphoribosyltransferase-like protein [Thermoplasmata archaeon]
MKDIDILVEKSRELKASGMNDKEIARELHLSVGTVVWLLTRDVKVEKPPSDVKIGWKSVGVYGHRIAYLSLLLSDIIEEETVNRKLEVDTIVGLAINGIPIASYISDQMELELAIFRPSQAENGIGALGSNFAGVKDKSVVIVDDFIGSGETMQSAIQNLKEQGAKPVLVITIVNKTDKFDILGVPVRSLIRARPIGIE